MRKEIKVTLKNGETVIVHRVDSDSFSNPRYVIHYSNIANTYSDALRISRNIGGKVYTAKWYDCGIVFRAYALADTLEYLMQRAGKM